MKKTKKILALSGGAILACTNLVGCTSNPTDAYLTELQNLKELKNYDFKYDIAMDMSVYDENINFDFTLEGEIINDEWFYTQIVYKNKTLSDIMIQDDKIYLNVGSIARNLTPDEGVSTEVIQVLSIMHTMLFDAKDYLCIDLKDYDLTAKELLTLFDTDSFEFYKTLSNIYLEQFKAIVNENKEIITQEDNKFHLKLNGEKISQLLKNISATVEERKTDLIPQLQNDITTILSMDVFENNLPNPYTDEELEDLAVMQYDSFIESMESFNYAETEVSQILYKEKDTYYSEYIFNITEAESDGTIMINLDSIVTDKKNSTEHTYSDSLPTDSIPVQKLIENFITYAGDMNIPLDSDILLP